MLKNKFVSLFLFLITTFSASFIGGITTFKFKEPWYSTLVKPSFNPPDWVFGPVWTILYILMAIAIWNVWIKSKNINLVYLYFIHLFFNTTWSVVFFGFNQIELALINLIVLILFIVILFRKYKVISKLSAYLMIPYILWCCFAFLLNLNLIMLN
jgi:tryptophan-rich sensory protein